MAVLNPDHLLDQADRLIKPAAGGAPRHIDLRRAISSAYYAIFHAIVTQATDDFVGRRQRHTPMYELVYRSIEHRAIKRICEAVVNQAKNKQQKKNAKQEPNLPKWYVRNQPKGGFGADLEGMAAAVIELYEKRQVADYDPLFNVSVSDATLAVDTGRIALGKFRTASRAARKSFVSLIVFPPR